MLNRLAGAEVQRTQSIREADGRYYVSFVVERDAAPLPPVENACGAGVRPGLVPAVGDEAGTRLARLA